MCGGSGGDGTRTQVVDRQRYFRVECSASSHEVSEGGVDYGGWSWMVRVLEREMGNCGGERGMGKCGGVGEGNG